MLLSRRMKDIKCTSYLSTYLSTRLSTFSTLTDPEVLQRTLSNNASRMDRNTEEWSSKSSDRSISRLYRDYRIAALSEEPPFDSNKNKYTIDLNGPPPFLFSSASRIFTKPPKVILTSDIAELARTPFEKAGFRVDTISPDLPESLQALAADCHLLGIGPSTVLDESFFRHVGYQPHRLWAIGHFGGGTKGIDLRAGSARGVACFHARNASSRSVAEKTVADIVALQRQIQTCSYDMHRGIWKPSTIGREIRGMTLGIIGYGRVGRQVSVMAETLGMRVLFHERKQDVLELGNAVRCHDLEEMLEQTDCLCLHMSGKIDGQSNFIGAKELSLLKKGSIVINNGNSNAVDIDALSKMLESNHVAGAAIDAFPSKPDKNKEFTSPLRGMKNVILTPSIAGQTVDATRAAAREVSTKLMAVLTAGSTATCVNLPQVEVTRPPTTAHRIVHMHRSVPGVMSNINSVIAATGANIHGQLLQTDGSHGYVILDVGRSQSRNHERTKHRNMMKKLKSALRAVPHTMYVRSCLRSNNTFGALSPEFEDRSGISHHERDVNKFNERDDRGMREEQRSNKIKIGDALDEEEKKGKKNDNNQDVADW